MNARAPLSLWMALVALLFGSLSPCHAILGIEQLRPGMRGLGKTVFEGTNVETFYVTIVDVLRGSAPNTDLILVRVGGKRIDEIGGICAGMSGSPVFIEGHLIGAIAFAEPLSDTHYGFVTPIKDMLKLFDLDKEQSASTELCPTHPYSHTPTLPLSIFNRFLLGLRHPQIIPHSAFRIPHSTLLPVKTPVMLSGLSSRASNRLSDWLKQRLLRPVQVAGGGIAQRSFQLQPGCAVGLQLVRGDVNVTALGTLTYKSGDKVVAFGHSFLQRGKTQMPFAPAVIHKVIKSLVMPFKVGSPTADLAGVITQDRERGVCGYLSKQPTLISLQVKVTDKDSGNQREVKAQVVKDPELLPLLAGVVALDGFDKAMDRIGEGSCELKWRLFGGGEKPLLQRTDTYFSETDIAAHSLGDLTKVLTALMQNEFKELDAQRLELEASVSRKRSTARVKQLLVTSKTIEPGSALKVKVVLQPFREAEVEKELTLLVPKDYRWQSAKLVARGRGQLSLADKLLSTQRTYPNLPKSVEELLSRLENEERNSDLVVELFAPQEARPAAGETSTASPRIPERSPLADAQGGSGGASTKSSPPAPEPLTKETISLPYVIYGSVEEEVKVTVTSHNG